MKSFTLTLDDFSPHPRAGLNFESIRWCEELIIDYPQIKINLFVPAAYCRLGEEACYISKNQGWLDELKDLDPGNYRINLHGMFHRRLSKKHNNSNNDEWQYLSGTEAATFLKYMSDELARAGFYIYGSEKRNPRHPLFKPTFRPPGWKISKAAVQVLQARGITCFAGSREYYEKVKDVLTAKWVNYNWDLTGPCKEKGNVIAVGHTSNWTNNYMNEERYNLIMDFLKNKNFKFKFIEDV